MRSPGLEGVLLMAYGTPASLADVERYYTHIRRGRPPEPGQLAELVSRYQAIGVSPLRAIVQAQASGLEAQLARRLGRDVPVAVGYKHAAPFIEDGVQALLDAEVTRARAIVLAPHYSALSVGEYRKRALAAAGEELEVEVVEHWHLAPRYVELLADRVRERRAAFPPSVREEVEVVFTAHSLPVRILSTGDPYPEQLGQTAAAVAERAGLERWSVAWQSAGRTDEQWIGPDILEIVRERAAAESPGLIACPAGFTCDHLEILYDLDVECASLAQRLGLPFGRTRSPNADPSFVGVLADVALEGGTPAGAPAGGRKGAAGRPAAAAGARTGGSRAAVL